jgi:ABC-type amino acid transport system permease subunit
LVKNSALASAIGVTELATQSEFLIGQENGKVSVTTTIIGVLLCYLVINLPAGYFIRLAEKRAAITR